MVEFFRDDTLSDLIGFTYATWHGDDAAHNLVNELDASCQAIQRVRVGASRLRVKAAMSC